MIKFNKRVKTMVKMYMTNQDVQNELGKISKEDKTNFIMMLSYAFYMKMCKIKSISHLPKDDQKRVTDLKIYDQYLNKERFQAVATVILNANDPKFTMYESIEELPKEDSSCKTKSVKKKRPRNHLDDLTDGILGLFEKPIWYLTEKISTL